MILGEMCVLLLISTYVILCMFCVVHYLIISCFHSLFSNYSNYVFLILFLFVFCLVFLYSILCILCFCVFFIVLCIVSAFMVSVSYFMYKYTDHCHPVETQLQ
jgi:hypothetical protein